jgi:hypothetical protein
MNVLENIMFDINVADLEDKVKECGLFPYKGWQYNEFPTELHAYCGKGLGLWQYPNQFAKYIDFIRTYPIKTYVEIGVAAGGTFIFTHEFLRKRNTEIKSYAVDIADIGKTVDCSKTPFDGILHKYIMERDECEFVHGTSYDLKQKYPSMEIYLLLIDGDHTYQGVKDDFDTLSGMSKIIVFHDIVSSVCPGVQQFWDEIKDKYQGRVYEFTDQYDTVSGSYLGIGILLNVPFVSESFV